MAATAANSPAAFDAEFFNTLPTGPLSKPALAGIAEALPKNANAVLPTTQAQVAANAIFPNTSAIKPTTTTNTTAITTTSANNAPSLTAATKTVTIHQAPSVSRIQQPPPLQQTEDVVQLVSNLQARAQQQNAPVYGFVAWPTPTPLTYPTMTNPTTVAAPTTVVTTTTTTVPNTRPSFSLVLKNFWQKFRLIHLSKWGVCLRWPLTIGLIALASILIIRAIALKYRKRQAEERKQQQHSPKKKPVKYHQPPSVPPAANKSCSTATVVEVPSQTVGLIQTSNPQQALLQQTSPQQPPTFATTAVCQDMHTIFR